MKIAADEMAYIVSALMHHVRFLPNLWRMQVGVFSYEQILQSISPGEVTISVSV